MIAPKLVKGDTIGIVSPSSPVTPGHLQLEAGIRFLEDMGFHIILGEHVFSNTLGYAARPQEKAADINTMFADPAIQGIFCSQGGVTANACLPYLDWDVIGDNPKVFLGISDITALLNPIYMRTSLVTFHGNDVMWGFGRDPAPYEIDELLARLVEGRIGLIPPNGERRTVRGGTAEGKLLGGNLHCLSRLAGTPYFPDFAGAIFFVEAIGLKSEDCDYMFTQLKQAGVFEKLQGAIVGYIDGLQNDPDAPIQMEDVLLSVTAEYDFPILKVDDFGHNCPNTVLPVGAKVKVNADTQQIEILEKCVANGR